MKPDVIVVGAGLAGLEVGGGHRDGASMEGARGSARRAAEALRVDRER